MASTSGPVAHLVRSDTQTLDPIACCITLDTGLPSAEVISEALRQRSPANNSSSSSSSGNLHGQPQPVSMSDSPAPVCNTTAAPKCVSAEAHELPASFLSAFAGPAPPALLEDPSSSLPCSCGAASDGGDCRCGSGSVPLPEQETLIVPLTALDKQQQQQQSAPAPDNGPSTAAGAAKAASPLPRAPTRQASVAAEGALGVDHGAGTHDPACTCPPYAVKSTCGKRSNMEDTYALCPNICQLPMLPMVTECADKFPQRIAMQLHSSTLMPHSSSAAVALVPGAVTAGPVGAQAAPAAARVAGGEGGPAPEAEDSLGSLSSADSDSVEKLHFFGVYDGHGGIEASQHCAQRLHHHLSKALTDIGNVWCESNQFVLSADANGASWEEGELEEVSMEAAGLGRTISSCSTGEQAAADAVEEVSNAGSAEESSDGASNGINCLMEDALRNAFLKTDEEFSQDGTAGLVGSTAVVALVGTHRVWIANCGDSRAVLSRNGRAIQVTDDHKPEREDEAERVEKAGGQVLYWNGHRVMGVLAMSRAIGDHCLRPYVIPEPEITVFARHAKDEIMLLASDGLWDVMSNQEATDLALRSIRRAHAKGASPKASARVAATVLTKAAVDRGSRDNITVVIIDLARPTEAQDAGTAKGPGSPQAGGAARRPASGAEGSNGSSSQQGQAGEKAPKAAADGSGGGAACSAAGAAAATATGAAAAGGSGSQGGGLAAGTLGSSGAGSVSSPFGAADVSPFVMPPSNVVPGKDTGGLTMQLDSVDLTGVAAVDQARHERPGSSSGSAGGGLEVQMTVVAPPPAMERQTSASPFSAFTAGPDMFVADPAPSAGAS